MKPIKKPKVRRTWDIDPVTKVVPSKKTYVRAKEKHNAQKEKEEET